MPRLKKKEAATPVAAAAAAPEPALTLTAGRSRRTIKPNRKYLNDSVVSMPPSKTSSRSSSPDSDLSEDEYRKNARDEEEEDDDDDDEEEVVVPVKSTAGRKSAGAAAAAAAAKKTTSSVSPGSRPRGRPPKSGKAAVKTEPVKNFRKEVLKKMDLTTLSVGKARVVLTPLKQDPKRKLDLDDTVEKEKPTARTTRESEKTKVAAKQQREPEKVPPAAVARERAKSEVRGVVKKKAEPPPKPETAKESAAAAAAAAKKDEADKKVINPVAVKKQLVEKSILDKRAKKVAEEKGDSGEEEEEEDDDDDVQIVGISRETNPVLGRKTARKSPLVAKQISPLPRKVPGKATPPVGLKRKAVGEPEPKQVRPMKNAKLSITIDSDDSVSDDDVEEVEDEPVRRKTRSSLPTEKDSAASSPKNSSGAAKAKDSPASARAKKETEAAGKATLSKSVSMPALDKTKQGLPGKSVQTPAAKSLGMSKPMAASTPKPSAAALPSKSKSEMNLVDPIQSPEKGSSSAEKAKAKSATIRIVDIGDIMKKRAASTPDIRKDAYASSTSSDSSDDEQSSDKPKTNTELVASILERKQAVNVDHLRTKRPNKRGRPPGSANKASAKAHQSKPTAEEDEIDFEDMLQTNIVTANKVQKVMQPAAGARQRRSDENSSKPTQNNNTLYKSNNNGRFGSNSSINRSGSISPHKNPPRILNSTMKMGDNRPFAKLVSNSGNKHYSIDLTDPDNNVKLVEASSDSPPPSSTPSVKRGGPPVKTITRPVTSTSGTTGLRNASNALNKTVGGAVQRSVSSLTAGSASSSPKMKKITCYETWYVINIPNSENKPEKPTFAMSMIGLGNEANKIQLPSAEWSHKIILTKRKTPPTEGDEVFNGDVEDRAINEEDKRNYEPCNIMFRRRTSTPGKFNLQYDRAVIFKNNTFFINVDGKNCQLVGAPTTLDDTADIETLLSVVDFVNLKSTCVELSAA